MFYVLDEIMSFLINCYKSNINRYVTILPTLSSFAKLFFPIDITFYI